MRKHCFSVVEWENAFLTREEDIANFRGYCEALDIVDLNPKEFFNIAWELSLNISRKEK